jgi:hypothetical protein
MPNVASGQRLRIFASDYNAMLAAAQALRDRQHDISVPLIGAGGAGIIPMRNDSGEDLPVFSVLDITGVVIEPADNEQEFLYRFTATGETPSNEDNPSLAITQEPIAAGKIGRVMVYGVTPAKLIREDDDESPTAGACGSTAHLQSAKVGAQVLWEEDYTGEEEHWALVRFPIVIGKKKSLDVVTDVTCNESTGQMDLETETIEYFSSKWKEEEAQP